MLKQEIEKILSYWSTLVPLKEIQSGLVHKLQQKLIDNILTLPRNTFHKHIPVLLDPDPLASHRFLHLQPQAQSDLPVCNCVDTPFQEIQRVGIYPALGVCLMETVQQDGLVTLSVVEGQLGLCLILDHILLGEDRPIGLYECYTDHVVS